MKSTQIFTGHNLILTEIKAVGPIMSSYKEAGRPFVQRRTLYVDIYLGGNVSFRHEHIAQTFMGEPTSSEQEAWQTHLNQLTAQRADLIQQWEEALFPTASRQTS
ncbi:hypothetical protein FAES_4059 [Fibrella aestuarina BUZ 2]|uniref:Uncharacterized protein n=1 Tax=Fibrella aestuarina BUZ 2 TaxID=1166018 RepID=I0KD56_9BACT|nr:hypothetical protein [Fibrella aestuarina]CCH02059.1 hypothetical protein FAES_4059 [Fibrella aestuarina BUZ 2]